MQPCHSSSSVLAKAPATVENSNSMRSMICRSRVSSPRRTVGAIDLARTRRRSVARARHRISSPGLEPSSPPSHISVVYTVLCISGQRDTTPANPGASQKAERTPRTRQTARWDDQPKLAGQLRGLGPRRRGHTRCRRPRRARASQPRGRGPDQHHHDREDEGDVHPVDERVADQIREERVPG